VDWSSMGGICARSELFECNNEVSNSMTFLAFLG
jgi:hypothetical protein